MEKIAKFLFLTGVSEFFKEQCFLEGSQASSICPTTREKCRLMDENEAMVK